jgi:hypothetical protein
MKLRCNVNHSHVLASSNAPFLRQTVRETRFKDWLCIGAVCPRPEAGCSRFAAQQSSLASSNIGPERESTRSISESLTRDQFELAVIDELPVMPVPVEKMNLVARVASVQNALFAKVIVRPFPFKDGAPEAIGSNDAAQELFARCRHGVGNSRSVWLL